MLQHMRTAERPGRGSISASIQEGPSSILGPETGYHNLEFSWFSSAPPSISQDITSNVDMATYSISLSNH
jgi:hypothetical protein